VNNTQCEIRFRTELAGNLAVVITTNMRIVHAADID